MAKEFSRIIVPVDGSNVSKKAAKKAFFIGKATGIEVEIVHVIEIPYVPSILEDANQIPYQNVYELLKQQAEKILNDISQLASKDGVSISQKILEGHPAEEIIKEAKTNDLIIIGNKGMTAIERIFLGSVTENVIHHATCPVMIVK